jgi:hypothetical protein
MPEDFGRRNCQLPISNSHSNSQLPKRTARSKRARHDERAMTSLDARESFDQFVTVERELLGYLTTALKRDETMLEQMRSAASSFQLPARST